MEPVNRKAKVFWLVKARADRSGLGFRAVAGCQSLDGLNKREAVGDVRLVADALPQASARNRFSATVVSVERDGALVWWNWIAAFHSRRRRFI